MRDRRISMVSLIQTLAVAEYLDHFHVANTFGAAQSGVKSWIRVLEEDFSIFLALAFNLSSFGHCHTYQFKLYTS